VAGLSRSVNYQLGVLRQILKRRGFWSPIADEASVTRSSLGSTRARA